MDDKILTALAIVAIVVLVANGLMLMFIRNAKNNTHIQLWQKVVHRSRNPWEEEDKSLKELSQLVKKLKGDENNEENPNKPDDPAP
jgi:hypothetical protein